MVRQKVSDAMFNKIKSDMDDGMTISKAVKKYGLSISTVSRIHAADNVEAYRDYVNHKNKGKAHKTTKQSNSKKIEKEVHTAFDIFNNPKVKEMVLLAQVAENTGKVFDLEQRVRNIFKIMAVESVAIIALAVALVLK